MGVRGAGHITFIIRDATITSCALISEIRENRKYNLECLLTHRLSEDKGLLDTYFEVAYAPLYYFNEKHKLS